MDLDAELDALSARHASEWAGLRERQLAELRQVADRAELVRKQRLLKFGAETAAAAFVAGAALAALGPQSHAMGVVLPLGAGIGFGLVAAWLSSTTATSQTCRPRGPGVH